MTYQLKRQKNGQMAVYSAEARETMHPGHGPWAEANHLYVQGGALARRLAAPPAPREAREVVVFDVGLGGAANALAAVTCHQDLLRRNRPVRPLHLLSFEQDGETLPFVIENAAALGYPRGYEAQLRALLTEGRVQLPGGLVWELRLGDFTRLIQSEPSRADVVFFDPFSPRTNPAMWRVSTLEAVHRCRRPGAHTELITYSSAFSVRAALLLAGFYVGEGPRLDAHRRTTIASTSFPVLAEPLPPGWLNRWRHDRDPWPPLTPHNTHTKIRQALLEHPQWSQYPERTPSRPVARSPARSPGGSRRPAPRDESPSASPPDRPPGQNRRREGAPSRPDGRPKGGQKRPAPQGGGVPLPRSSRPPGQNRPRNGAASRPGRPRTRR